MKVRNRLSHLPRMLSPIEQFRDNMARVQALSGLHQAFGELITASELNLTSQDVKNRLRAIVNRRNQIVHEADLDPSIPGAMNRWPISPLDVASALDFIHDICEAIHIVVNV